MADRELFELVDELKKTEKISLRNDLKYKILQKLANEFDSYLVTKPSFEKYKKWVNGITLKEFKEEVEKLGLTIEEDKYWLKWHIKFKGCIVATIDPINDSVMQTSTLFFKLYFKDKLFELMTNLAYTCKEDRGLEDYFEEWQYEE